MFRENQMVEETILLKEIQKNNTRKQEVQKKLEKEQILQKNHRLADIKYSEQ